MVKDETAPKRIAEILKVSEQFISKRKLISESRGATGLRLENAFRKAFDENQTFIKVKECFKDNLREVTLGVEKSAWYWNNP